MWHFLVLNLPGIVQTAVGAIIGSLLTAIPTYHLASVTGKQTLKRDAATRRATQATLAFSLVVKLQQILNGFVAYYSYLRDEIERAEREGGSGIDLWAKVRPLAGMINTSQQFNSAELSILVEANAYELLNKILNIAVQYNALEAGLRDYSKHRLAFTDQNEFELAEGVNSFSIKKKESKSFDLKALELNQLVEQLLFLSATYCKEMINVSEKVGEVLRQLFDDQSFPVLDTSELQKLFP